MEFLSPKHIADCHEILDGSSDSLVICAGLTHLLRFYSDFPYGPQDSPEGVLHIGDLSALSEIKDEGSRYGIGATAKVCQLENDAFVARFAPAVWDAARLTSTPQIRNQRTLGGEISWGSFHSPLAAALMAFDAQLRVRRGRNGENRAREESIDLLDFYEDTIERKNVQGRQLSCRKAKLAPRDLILRICVNQDLLRRPGTFSFFRALTPKISTENSGVVVAVHGVMQGGVLVKAQFVSSGLWMSTLKDELPFEGIKLKPNIFFEKLYHFCERYPFESYRMAGPSARQLGLIVFGLLKEGFSYILGVEA